MPNNSEMVKEIVGNVQLIFKEELSNFIWKIHKRNFRRNP